MVTIYCERHLCETFFTDIFNLFCFCPRLAPPSDLSPPTQISQHWYASRADTRRTSLRMHCLWPSQERRTGFKRTQTSYYCRESEGFVSCRLFWALPTSSSTTSHIQLQEDPHHAPWQPTPSSTKAPRQPHLAPLQPTPEAHTWWVGASRASSRGCYVDPQEVIIIFIQAHKNCTFPL